MLNKQVRVNITTAVNKSKIRKETRNGREVIIVPSATLPDNVIMNGIKYPPEEIKAGFKSLNRTPAPLGHPTINGKFVSARDPEGINLGWIGAWNENVRQEDGRVLLDKVIDVEVANSTERGKSVLAAIEKGDPINTSTGLLCTLEAVANAADHKFIARNMSFDHDAILLNETGAATPEQGVGMLVNSEGESEEITVINSTFSESADRELDWAVDSVIQAVERKRRAGMLEQAKTALMKALGLSDQRDDVSNHKEDNMDEKFMTELSKKVDTLSETVNKLGETVGKSVGDAVANALKPLTDAHAAQVANQQAQEAAEHAELVTKVVKANLLNEADAKATPLATLRALAPKTTPVANATALNAAQGTGGNASAFKLPDGE